MAINTPHGEKAEQSPSASKDDDVVAREGACGSNQESSHKDIETLSSLSSHENLPSALSSPLSSPCQSHFFNVSPSSQTIPPLASPYELPSRLSSSSSLQSPPPSLQSPPASLPSPYLHSNNISIEELNELALQDSENNNVDENSNEGFDQYAAQIPPPPQASNPDQSVRPRVRPQQSGRDQLDTSRMRRRSSSGSFTHRRNLSEDLACSPTTNFSFQFDHNQDNTNEYDRLPRLPNYHHDPRSEWSAPEPLPRREDGFLQSVSRVLPLSLNRSGYRPQTPPDSDSIANDAHDLLNNFTYETLRRNRLPSPNTDILRGGYRTPTLCRVGQELRKLADAFAETEERRKVRCMAESVHLESIDMENFFQLCRELFMGGITRERIVALFTFIGDIAVSHVRRQGSQFLNVLMTWSFRYLVENICRWVQKEGGWGRVLTRGATAVYHFVVVGFCLIGTVAAGVYILKTIKDW